MESSTRNIDNEILLKVFTLNCWGIPFVSKDRRDRMKAISQHLAEGLYDVVCLQEVWNEQDYVFITKKVSDVMPHSHYFYSGVCGSGICILSKWPIIEVFFHAWALNGYFHMIHHGDWYGGKGVGLCRIKINDLTVNVYSAHLHAEYNTADIYFTHRVLQAFYTAEFIKLTSACSDLSILAGDLNTQSQDLPYKMMCSVAKLKDTCNPCEISKTCEGNSEISSICSLGTSERLGNTYTDPVVGTELPEGKRIDYILYHTGSSHQAEILDYSLPLRHNVPDKPFSYSDHDAVSAVLKISKRTSSEFHESSSFAEILSTSITVCAKAIDTLRFSEKKYLFFASGLFIFLLGTVGVADQMYIDIPRLFLAVVMFYLLFMGTLWNYMERNGILAGQKAMQIIHERLVKNESNSVESEPIIETST